MFYIVTTDHRKLDNGIIIFLCHKSKIYISVINHLKTRLFEQIYFQQKKKKYIYSLLIF